MEPGPGPDRLRPIPAGAGGARVLPDIGPHPVRRHGRLLRVREFRSRVWAGSPPGSSSGTGTSRRTTPSRSTSTPTPTAGPATTL
ncbi:MAG: hypothetical protein M0C28_01210 [Candidatus Moduliflexus flocculans]|nr:hypothetical protein [Candidatus Moduliflexus flocculans]